MCDQEVVEMVSNYDAPARNRNSPALWDTVTSKGQPSETAASLLLKNVFAVP